jgi:hypothetical protein
MQHVFIYKTLDYPAKYLAQAETDNDGTPKIDLHDPYLVKRFYNTAQLALVTCSLLKKVGPDQAQNLINLVNEIVYADYYVIAASARDKESASEFDAVVQKSIRGDQLTGGVNKMIELVMGAQIPGFYDKIKQGANICGVTDEIRDQIYANFQMNAEISEVSGSNGQPYSVLFGGRLNVNQATIISDFFKKTVFSLPE